MRASLRVIDCHGATCLTDALTEALALAGSDASAEMIRFFLLHQSPAR